MSTSNTVKTVTEAATLITTGFAVYKGIGKLVNPKAKAAAGTDAITKASQAVTRTVNKQMKAVAESVNKILPEFAQVRAAAIKLPESGVS